MKLTEVYKHHINVAKTYGTEVKLYVECIISDVDQQVIRTHLDSQSIGPTCKGLHPIYRALPTSLLTVVASTTSSIPELNVDGSICCYRSGLCEETDNPQTAIQFSTQSIKSKHTIPLKQLTNSTLIIESVYDHYLVQNELITPQYVQKENGTTYLPIQDTDQPMLIIEVFQVWKASTFAEVEYKSISIPTHKERYGIRVSAVPSSNFTQTPQTIHNTIQRLAKFLDLLVYG